MGVNRHSLVNCNHGDSTTGHLAHGRVTAARTGIRAWGEIMGSPKGGVVKKSQPVLMVIDPMIFTRTPRSPRISDISAQSGRPHVLASGSAPRHSP
eukprot:COSAG01_NODE_2771_length_7101_cov_12.982148_11_plen_96_part_00